MGTPQKGTSHLEKRLLTVWVFRLEVGCLGVRLTALHLGFRAQTIGFRPRVRVSVGGLRRYFPKGPSRIGYLGLGNKNYTGFG